MKTLTSEKDEQLFYILEINNNNKNRITDNQNKKL